MDFIGNAHHRKHLAFYSHLLQCYAGAPDAVKNGADEGNSMMEIPVEMWQNLPA
jgi:hypothetical protein